jgi:hypothetical protein
MKIKSTPLAYKMINETFDTCTVVISNIQNNPAIWAILLFKTDLYLS